jgi:hypothetical protein
MFYTFAASLLLDLLGKHAVFMFVIARQLVAEANQKMRIAGLLHSRSQ